MTPPRRQPYLVAVEALVGPAAIGCGIAVTISIAVAKACIWAGRVTARLTHLDECIHRLDGRMDRIDGRLDRIERLIRDGPDA